jgi:hypothetical protein
MIVQKITNVVLNGKNKDEYDAIRAKLLSENAEGVGWKLTLAPLINRVTAVKTEQVEV